MNSYQVFSEPRLAFNDVFASIKAAQKSIYVEAYELENDSIGRELIRLLAKKSLTTKVTLIVDSYGFNMNAKEIKLLITSSKIEFIRFNPLFKHITKGRFSRLITKLTTRSHRKLTIIDEKIAYTGGTNYTQEELDWRDLFVKIKGPLVGDLVRSFKEIKKIAKRTQFFKIPLNKNLTKQFNKYDILIRQIPNTDHRPLRRELKRICKLAKEEICITTPYFIPDVPFLNIIRKALKRGVSIKILIPKYSDKYLADVINDFFAELATTNKCQVYLLNKMSHAKYLIVDKKVATFGSANFDYQAFHRNYELNVMSADQHLATSLHKLFTSDCKNAVVHQSKFRKNKSWYRKTLEKILHRFRRYF